MPSNVVMVTATGAAGGGQEMDILSLLMGASGVVMGVLFLLISLSVVSWFIIGYKALYYARASSQSTKFLDEFWNAKRLDAVYQSSEALADSPVAQMFRAAYIELTKVTQQKQQGSATGGFGEASIENVERALHRAHTTEMTHLESLIPFLATTGSAAPFVGLFGTVWGIMNSFRSIGAKGAANLSTVAPGIAEALIATAIGLVAAIPAVMAFNYFTRKVKVLSSEMDAFSSDFLNICKRHFLR